MPNDDKDKTSDASLTTNVTLTKTPQPPQQQPVEQVQAPQPQPIDEANQVKVQPIRSYTDSATGQFVTPKSDPYVVTRLRAADLFAVGLIEYVDDADEDAMIEAQAEAATATAKAAVESRRSKTKS